jgi:HEAT repeats
MKSYRPMLVLLVVVLVPPLATAGIFFNRKSAKVDPAQKVQQLLITVKSDGDESKRASAAEDLRDFDAGQYPEMIPVLADVLLTDQKVSVRAEAAQTLGKVRPINQQAGWALEQAANKDNSLRVRLAAKTALMGYYMAGFKGGKKEQGFPSGKEPPLADPAAKMPPSAPTQPTVRTPQSPNGVQPTRVIPNETPPPPLADPDPRSAQPRTTTPLVPSQVPVLQPAPSGDEGPMLVPPG